MATELDFQGSDFDKMTLLLSEIGERVDEFLRGVWMRVFWRFVLGYDWSELGFRFGDGSKKRGGEQEGAMGGNMNM